MRVKSIVAHESADHVIHQPGDVYALEGLELALRLKDGIVVDATAAPAPEPSIAATVAAARASTAPVADPPVADPPVAATAPDPAPAA